MRNRCFWISIVILLVLVACGDGDITLRPPSETIHVTGVSLNKTEITLEVDSVETLVATAQPGNATNKKVSWLSNNTAVATVNNGIVTANAIGAATITVITQDGNHEARCNITVALTNNVYAVGAENNVAVFWKNKNTPIRLSNSYSQANAVFVADYCAYVAGYENNPQGISIAKLWMIDDATQTVSSRTLTNGNSDANANSVFVAGNVVYVAGYEYVQGKMTATLWKSGDATKYLSNLNNGAFGNASASAVFVSGSDIYVAGSEHIYANGKAVATLWKNNEAPKRLSCVNDGAFGNANANSVFVSAGNVYVVGHEYNYSQAKNSAFLWKNNDAARILNDSGNDANAYSVFVSGNKVYVAGYEYLSARDVATLWEVNENTYKRLSELNSQAYSVYAIGNDVYLSGTENGSAILWKNNGVFRRLNNGVAKAVFLEIN